MHTVTNKSLLISFAILSLATLAGWLLTDKVVGRHAGIQLIKFVVFFLPYCGSPKRAYFLMQKNRFSINCCSLAVIGLISLGF